MRKVLFVSDIETIGGSGIAAARLANSLADQGCDVTWVYNNPDGAPFGEERTWRSLYAGLPRPLAVLANGTKRIAPRAAYLAGNRYSTRLLERTVAEVQPDVIHVHALHNSYWNDSSIAAATVNRPTVWTFHDNWSFSPESYLFVGPDGREERLKPDGANRAESAARKRRYFDRNAHAQLVANSRFTARYAASWLGREPQVIYYGLPLEKLAPVAKPVAREALQIPSAEFVVGFIADSTRAPIKGFDVLAEALRQTNRENWFGIAVGDGPAGDYALGKVRVRAYGRVANPRLLAALYSAADVFVVPSRAEALGMVSMESIACGTPVIGSRVGGIPEIVREGETGWLFSPGSAEELRARIEAAFAARAMLPGMVKMLRQTAVDEWSQQKYAAQYRAVYNRAAEAVG